MANKERRVPLEAQFSGFEIGLYKSPSHLHMAYGLYNAHSWIRECARFQMDTTPFQFPHGHAMFMKITKLKPEPSCFQKYINPCVLIQLMLIVTEGCIEMLSVCPPPVAWKPLVK